MPTEIANCVRNPLVVRCDSDDREASALLTSFPDVLDEGFSRDEMEWLARKAGGTPAGRDNTEDLIGRGRHGTNWLEIIKSNFDN